MDKEEILAVIKVLSQSDEPESSETSESPDGNQESNSNVEEYGNTKRGKYECRTCGDVFTKKLDMHIHRITHTSKKETSLQDSEPVNEAASLGAELNIPLTTEKICQQDEIVLKIERSTEQEQDPTLFEDCTSTGMKRNIPLMADEICRQIYARDKIDFRNEMTSEQQPQSSGFDFNSRIAIDPDNMQQTNNELSLLAHLQTTLNRTLVPVGKTYKCSTCHMSFTHITDYREHIKSHPDKLFKCEACGKVFTMKGNLQRHEQVHQDIRPFGCEICNKSFSQKTHLEAHLNVHEEDRTYYVCSVCGNCFTRRGNLRRHERIHTKEKPYQCHLCGRCFTQPGNLKAHTLTHTEERPYECSECGKTFTRKGNLTRHLDLHRERGNFHESAPKQDVYISISSDIGPVRHDL